MVKFIFNILKSKHVRKCCLNTKITATAMHNLNLFIFSNFFEIIKIELKLGSEIIFYDILSRNSFSACIFIS